MNTDMHTLEGVRNILTVKNSTKLAIEGECTPGTEVRCLRKNNNGYYIPCLAYIVAVHPSGRFTVDLWTKRNERVTVSTKAVLWPSKTRESLITDGYYSCSFCPCRYAELPMLGEHNKTVHDGVRA